MTAAGKAGAAPVGVTAGGKAGGPGAARPKAPVKKRKHRAARTASAPAGPLRLFRRSLVDFGGLVGTVLFAGLVLGLLALLGSSTRLMRPPPDAGRDERTRRAAVFAVGIWLFTGILLFSFSGRVHPRYLEAFTPAVAAALGVSLSVLAGRVRDRSSLYLLAGGLGLSLLESLVAVGPGSLVRAGVGLGLLIGLAGCGLAYRELRDGPASGTDAGAGPGAGSAVGEGKGSARGEGAVSARGEGARLTAGRRWSLAGSIVVFSLVALLSFPVARDIGLIRGHTGVQAAAPEFAPGLVSALSVYLRDHQTRARYEFAATAPSIAAPLIIKDVRPILLLTTVDARPLVTLAGLRAAIAAHEVSYVVMHGHCPHPPFHLLAACSAAARWVEANGRDVTASIGYPALRTGVLFRVG